MPSLKNRAPKYSKFRNGAGVSIDGQYHYLPGKYGSEESLEAYRGLIATWKATSNVAHEDEVSVAELLAGYVAHAESYYANDPNRVAYLNRLIRILRQHFVDLPVTEFGPKRLKAVRQVFIELRWVRKKGNEATRDVIALFSWGVEQELVPGGVVHALREVRSLRKGRCAAPESRAIQPVEQATVNATCEHLPPMGNMVANLPPSSNRNDRSYPFLLYGSPIEWDMVGSYCHPGTHGELYSR